VVLTVLELTNVGQAKRLLILAYTAVVCLSGCTGRHLLVRMGGQDGSTDAEHAPADTAASAFETQGPDALAGDADGPASSDAGIAPADTQDMAVETAGTDAPARDDTGAQSLDATDSAIERQGVDDAVSVDTNPWPPDGMDSGESDGVSPLAGLRIAFVGTANPSPELTLVAWLSQSTGVVPARILTTSTTLTADLLAGYDVLILERLVRSYSQAEAAVLTDWVSVGGAVLSVSGFYSSGSDTTNTNSLLSGIGIAYGGYLLGNGGGPFYITDLASHPVMDGITSLPFWGGFAVQPTDTADSIGTDTTLATTSAQPVCIAQVRLQGRVLVWGDEWIENDAVSTLPDVRRFWQQALTWLARR
jgi:hypothetical protein